MILRYYVRTVRTDGTVTLSQPFSEHRRACLWARIARRDTRSVVQALVITRTVQPIDSPPRPPAA